MSWRHVLLALGLLAGGCDADGDANSAPDARTEVFTPSAITVQWKLLSSAGHPQPCPTGFDTAEVIVLSARAGEWHKEPFPCAAGSGNVSFGRSPRDSYGVMVRITNGPGGQVYGESDPTGAPDGGVTVVTVVTDRGRLTVHWTLSQGGVSKTCQELGIDEVQVEVTPTQGQPDLQSEFCVLRQATTYFLPTGTARIVVTAGAASGSLDDVPVPAGSLTADAPPINLAF